MANELPSNIVDAMNRLRWTELPAFGNDSIALDGTRLTHPEGSVFFAWMGYQEAQHMADALKSAGIKADYGQVEDASRVEVPPSQLQALAENGVDFAKKAFTPDYKPAKPWWQER